jgi:3-oxoacyl-[acyl-carrier-protein] synthase III
MTVYYNFINMTKNYQYDAFSMLARDFHKCEIYKKEEIFKTIIEKNNWNNDDIILAVANIQNRNIYKYINGKLSIANHEGDVDYVINENNKRKRIVDELDE